MKKFKVFETEKNTSLYRLRNNQDAQRELSELDKLSKEASDKIENGKLYSDLSEDEKAQLLKIHDNKQAKRQEIFAKYDTEY